jgi:heme exporter protein D
VTRFFAMGGYAAFVWPAFAITILALGGAVVQTLHAYRRAKAVLDSIERRNAP